MKRTTLVSITASMIIGLISCENQEWEFPDFDYKAVYFPYQYPVRTLVLGDYLYNNENDNDLKFLISAAVGGMYENKWNWTVDYTIDTSYTQQLITVSGDTIKPLPIGYYTLTPANQIIIPKGKFYGSIEVQLTEAFLDNPNAHKLHYVIPLKITGSNADTILSGRPSVSEPDPRIAADWEYVPKNFTLFGIKYINPYHGRYLHRGQSVIKDGGGNITQTIVYRQRFVEKDEVWQVQTYAKNAVTVSGILRKTPTSPGNFILKLTFDSNNNCEITSTTESAFAASGTGKFVKNGDEWGGQKRDAIHLNYTINDGTHTHTITDTLVFRDKGLGFEEFVPVVYVP
jgi:hypothetical protein